MSNPPTPVPDHASYIAALDSENDRLESVLAAIRTDEDSGELCTQQAAEARVSAYRAYQMKLADYRAEFLGEGEGREAAVLEHELSRSLHEAADALPVPPAVFHG